MTVESLGAEGAQNRVDTSVAVYVTAVDGAGGKVTHDGAPFQTPFPSEPEQNVGLQRPAAMG